jgi:hypothetical protein
MPHQDIEFLQQFRKAAIILPYEDRQYGNVCFRHFSKNRKEKTALEEVLENQLAHSEVIDGLVGKMEKADKVADYRLTVFLQKLSEALSAFIRNNPNSAVRFKNLMAEVSSFSELVRLYQMRTQPLLLDALKNISAERKAARNSGYVGSRNVRSMQVLVRKYRDTLYRYHDVFAGLGEEESEKVGKVTVTTPLGDCLRELSLLIGSRIAAIETTFNGLGEWKMKLRLAEIQGSYN